MNDLNFDALVMQIGKRILEIRKAKEMSQSEFCALCDLDKRGIQRLEKGQTAPTIRTLYKITNAVGIDLLEFFNFLNQKKE